MQNQEPFKKRYNLEQRTEKAKKQMSANPGKIVIIVEKAPKSTLPSLQNPRYVDYDSGFCARRSTNSA